MNTEAIMAYALTTFAPVIVLGIGFAIIMKAFGGKSSAVAKMLAITVLGLVVLGGAGALVKWGDNLASIAFKG